MRTAQQNSSGTPASLPSRLVASALLAAMLGTAFPLNALADGEHPLAGQDPHYVKFVPWEPHHGGHAQHSMPGMEEPKEIILDNAATCRFQNVKDPLPQGASIQAINGALTNVGSGEFAAPGSCFNRLTQEDRAFMASFADKLAAACLANSESGPVETPDCREKAGQVWQAELSAHRAKYGTAALERVLDAYHANRKRIEAMQVLELFSEPKAAEVFRDYAKAYVDYLAALRAASHDEIKPEAMLSYPRRVLLKVVDGLGAKADPNGRVFSANPIVRQHSAAEILLWANIKLKNEISKAPLEAAQKKALMGEVDALYSHASDQTQIVADGMEEDRAAAKLGLSGVAAAATLLMSVETMGQGMHLAQGAGGILKASGMGAASITTMNLAPLSASQAIHSVLASRSEASLKGSRFLCELSKHFSENGDKYIKDSWDTVKASAPWGAGALAVTSTLGKLSPAAGVILSGFLAVPLTVAMTKQMFDMEGMRRNYENTLAGQGKEAASKSESGEIPPGMRLDVERLVAKGQLKQTADRWGDVAMMAGMVPHIPHMMMAFPNALSAETFEKAGGAAALHQH